MAFDQVQFKRWLSTVKGAAPDTVAKKMARLRAAQRDYSFNPDAFLASEEGAQDQGMGYLDQRRDAEVKPMTYNQDVWFLNDLAEFGRRTQRFNALQVPDEGEPRPLSASEEARVLAWNRGKSPDRTRLVRALLHFFCVMGLRPHESSKIRLRNFEEDGKGGMWLHIVEPGKLGKKRWLWCPSHLFSPKRPFGAYWTWRKALKAESDHLWVVCNWRASSKLYRAMSRDSLRQAISTACREQGVAGNTGRIRDTVLTRITMGDNSDILDAAHQAGHRRVDTTRKRYVRYTREDFRRRARSAQSDRFAKGGSSIDD